MLVKSYLLFLSLGFHVRMALANGHLIAKTLSFVRLWELLWATIQAEGKTVNYNTVALLSLRSIGGSVLSMGWRKFIRSAVVYSSLHPFIFYSFLFLFAILIVFSVKLIFLFDRVFYFLFFFTLILLGFFGKKVSEFSAASITRGVKRTSTDYFK